MPNAFRRVRVEPNVSPVLGLGSYIEWWMDPRFGLPGPWTFYVERAESLNGVYSLVATTENQPYAYDPTITADKSGLVSWWYRIRVKTGDGKYFVSDPVSAGDTWEKRDWLVGTRIINKEMLLLKKRSGQDGILLKRRTIGDQCTKCVDPATGEPQDSHCSVCFGTGFVGGYYDPIPFWLSTQPTAVTVKQDEFQGTTVVQIDTARAVTCPIPNAADIWISNKTSQCFRIGSTVKVEAHLRGNPIIVSFNLGLLPSSDIIYTYVAPSATISKQRQETRTT